MYLNYYLQQLRYIVYMAPVLLIAITAHEFAHGWMSERLPPLFSYGLGEAGTDQHQVLPGPEEGNHSCLFGGSGDEFYPCLSFDTGKRTDSPFRKRYF